MSDFQAFNTFEEMMAHEREQQRIAYEWITDDQWNLADGKTHWFVNPVPMEDQILVIWGWTWDWDRDLAEVKALPVGENRSEREFEQKSYREALTRGFVFSRCFSVLEVIGELGSKHISQLVEISEQEFKEGQMAGWNPTPEVVAKIESKFKQSN